MSRAKELLWRVKEDWVELYTRILLWLPLSIGIIARQTFLPLILGSFGKNTRILPGLQFTTPKKLFIGSNCQFASDIIITAGGTVRIGDWVGVGPGAKIWSLNHKFSDPDVPYMIQGWDLKEVVIEDDVWIGANAFIMPGVHIGKGAVISAGTVVIKSVPSYAVVAGNPGRVVGWRKKLEDSAALKTANLVVAHDFPLQD